MEETKVRLRAESFADHYSHARLFYRSQTDDRAGPHRERARLRAFQSQLEHVRNRVMANLRNVDEELAERVAAGLGMALPAKSKAAAEPRDMKPSPALRIIDKYPATLEGRTIAVLVSEGADGKIVNAVKKQAEAEGATVKIVAPKVGGVTLKDGSALPADGQLAGMPSVLFDAVAIVLSEDGCREIENNGAATDFAKNAFGHLKAIGFTQAAKPLLDAAGVKPDDAVIDLSEGVEDFIQKAKTRLWEREPKVRLLA